MSKQIYDLAVIGGGINGAGIARDAAGRGAHVILLERGDLARGTSSASTKLIHGGLRYLEHYEFALVRESLIERERLWAIAPHIIWPLRFILPHQKGIRPAWLVRLGLFLYDHIGGRKLLPATRTVNLKTAPAGKPLRPEFVKAFEYSDCWVDDARLVVLNAMDAGAHGADIRTRSEVTHLERRDGLWHIEIAGQAPILARAVANAAGPAVLDLLARTTGHDRKTGGTIRLVRGSHIVVRKMFDTPQAYFCQNPDGRIFFAIPYEDDFTLIGTTDADHKGSLDDIHATPEEIDYICQSAGAYFKQSITAADVIYSFAGVRPLVDDGAGKPETASRGYHFELDVDGGEAAPILSVFGGKITTYRHLAESAVDKLAVHLPILKGQSWTLREPLPGGDFPIDGAAHLAASLAREYGFLPPALVHRWVRSYGTKTQAMLAHAHNLSDLGTDFGHDLYAAEVDYLIDHEWAQSAEDILWRRSKLGLRFSVAATQKLEKYVQQKLHGQHS
ncbi:MAG: glycerol-3-phosphate dehydrogenase [Sphingomonadales bacterium 28-55-16]|nr:MAG: glycerol-3-phosphate dehydrogenase [Sphingomonadales bacterium 28-55-16]